jgi:hypothetical protein
MSWLDSLSDIVKRYSGQGGGTSAAPQDPNQDYEQAALAAPQDVVAGGLSEAFQSDRTPAFPEMLSNLFGHSDPNQRAGLLNRLLASVGPGTLASLPGLAGGQVTPEQANQVSPEQVQQLAAHAQKQDPSIVDQVSSFYAQHPQVVKALGGMALAIALQHMTRRR